MTDQKKQPEVNTPSVVLSFKFASEEAQRRATKEGASFAVYLISAGPWEGRHTFEPSNVRVPSTWTHVQTFEPEVAALEVGAVTLEDAEPSGPLCQDCERGLVLSADGTNHIFGEGVGDVRPCAAAFNVEVEEGGFASAMLSALTFAQRAARAERSKFVVYEVTTGSVPQLAKLRILVRRASLKINFGLFNARAKVAKEVEPAAPSSQVINCPDCWRGVALNLDGGTHVFAGDVGPRRCGVALDTIRLGVACDFAVAAANQLKVGFVIYRVTSAAGVTYAVRRMFVKLDFELLAKGGATFAVAKTVRPREESGAVEEFGLKVQGAPSEARNPYPEGATILLDATPSAGPRCSFIPHVERGRAGLPKAIHVTCGCQNFSAVVRDDTLQTSEDELHRRAFAEYAKHVGTVEPRITVEPKPFVVHATRGDVTTIVGGPDPRAMVCGKELQPTQLFAGTPSGANVTNCPACVEATTRAHEAHHVFGRFSFAVENYPDPARHELLTLFGKRIGGEGGGAKIVNAFCTCGEWNFGFEVGEDLSDLSALEEARSRHAELHLRDLPADEDEDRATYEAPTKREEILRLYEEGTTDIAELVRRVKARPSYVAQVLQQAGHLEGVFDLYTTTGREQNLYTRYFRNVLAFRNVEAARASVEKIDRLYNYFERLGDRAGQHQATVLALTGKNRARWSGKLEESEVFSEWLNAH